MKTISPNTVLAASRDTRKYVICSLLPKRVNALDRYASKYNTRKCRGRIVSGFQERIEGCGQVTRENSPGKT